MNSIKNINLEKRSEIMKDGVLFVNKDEGKTSREVVNEISKIYKTKKVGHTGTLDPMATGVLIICLGKYTKLVNLLTSYEKEYVATMKLGIKTDTKDRTGNILKQEKVSVTKEQIENVFQNFPRKYLQEVPKYSAVKVKGKKLYEYARENKEVELPKRQVEIFSLKILDMQKDRITFQTKVSKGTYIRSLIEDIASRLSTVAVMESLQRISQGNVNIKDCLTLKEINQNTPLKQLDGLFSYPIYEITEFEKRKVENGNKLILNTQEETIFLSFQKQIIAIYQKKEDFYQMIFKVV